MIYPENVTKTIKKWAPVINYMIAGKHQKIKDELSIYAEHHSLIDSVSYEHQLFASCDKDCGKIV